MRYTIVDAFTAEPFAGNPAAVLLLPSERDDRWLAAVAREMSLSETAFLVRRGDGFSLRWFTPACEVDLCGHATLASAHVLFEEGLLAPAATARFQTRSGVLLATHPGRIELDFPARPAEPTAPPPALLPALGAPATCVGKNVEDYLVLVEDEAALAALAPDFRALRVLGSRGVIVTAPSTRPGIDFVSRFFAPGVGVDEDPVTGSAHTCLAPYWGARLGKRTLVGRQISTRGGVVHMRLLGERVILGGDAVTVARGELLA